MISARTGQASRIVSLEFYHARHLSSSRVPELRRLSQPNQGCCRSSPVVLSAPSTYSVYSSVNPLIASRWTYCQGFFLVSRLSCIIVSLACFAFRIVALPYLPPWGDTCRRRLLIYSAKGSYSQNKCFCTYDPIFIGSIP